MISYSKPLGQNPFHKWGKTIAGSAEIDPALLADSLAGEVRSLMSDTYGIGVKAERDVVTVGGIFNRTSFPGVLFTFEEHINFAGYVVGINKKAAIITVDVVQYGEPSRAYQRMNVAQSKGTLSLSGALQRAITDQDAVETEDMYYGVLLQAIATVVESWTE